MGHWHVPLFTHKLHSLTRFFLKTIKQCDPLVTKVKSLSVSFLVTQFPKWNTTSSNKNSILGEHSTDTAVNSSTLDFPSDKA